MSKMIDYLRARGTERLVGYVLRENRDMRELALAHGFAVNPSSAEPGTLHVVLDLQRPAAARSAA
jgi:acetyltransferase